eukprot:403375922
MQTLFFMPYAEIGYESVGGHFLNFMMLVKERENDCNLEIIKDENLRRPTQIETYWDTHKVQFEL